MVFRFPRSTSKRLMRVTVGFPLIVDEGSHPSLLGSVLMMIGIVLTVTETADICLLEEAPVVRSVGLVAKPRSREHRAYHTAAALEGGG